MPISLRPLLLALSAGLSLLPIGCSLSPQAWGKPESSPASTPASTARAAPTAEDQAIPRYDHIFVILEENKGYGQIIGNPKAPVINQLAKTYGLATQFYGVVHPSEANYIALLGGSTFGIHDDDAFYCQAGKSDRFCGGAGRSGYANHTVSGPSLMTQLEQRQLTWKGYFEDLPAPGSKVVFAPNETRALYAVKHNGFMSFQHVQSDPNLSNKVVGLGQLALDLQSGQAPNYSHIVLNQCHEMHGLPECPDLQPLIKTGDMYVGKMVEQIMQSPVWKAPGNSAIVITWDEDHNPHPKLQPQGCCGFDPKSAANFGGGHIATIVITNHGRRGVIDRTPYNHYSLLRTTEDAFGIHDYLNEAGETGKGVKPMTALFSK